MHVTHGICLAFSKIYAFYSWYLPKHLHMKVARGQVFLFLFLGTNCFIRKEEGKKPQIIVSWAVKRHATEVLVGAVIEVTKYWKIK